jgi:hypothetical protein
MNPASATKIQTKHNMSVNALLLNITPKPTTTAPILQTHNNNINQNTRVIQLLPSRTILKPSSSSQEIKYTNHNVPEDYYLYRKIRLLARLWALHPYTVKEFQMETPEIIYIIGCFLQHFRYYGSYLTVQEWRLYNTTKGVPEFLSCFSPKVELGLVIRWLLLRSKVIPRLKLLGDMVVPLMKQMKANITGEKWCVADFSWVEKEADLKQYINDTPEEF